ncbi:PIN domain-containing protein [Saccharopolyspora aridisoli]|uniref:PIN domain-containing protein n=1 Tax=Saccharopolyspora aridisoli TaxID=2530385 RepID=A0A4R4US44_9PSEU|nr:type II toxin-antitoxin system VapC family toxin [Saccharopolyspora aridisoli]TDC94810.1 PIN domain-containing protein [Saccharopolyspora aridisoli]
MIYFDSSALIKMIAPEPESQALSQWIRDRWEQPRVTSALSKVEVLRNFRERGPAAEDLASIVVSKLETLPVQQEVLDTASELRAGLGPVDAIHLASACGIRNEPVTYVSYDPALIEAAKEAGLSTASPA